jgi:competence protein ComEC
MSAGGRVTDNHLDALYAGDSLLTQVRIVDFPRRSGAAVLLLVTPLDDRRLPPVARVAWFDSPERPSIGDIWELEVRLKRPRGDSNPGLFDFEAWLFRQRINATGYVVNGTRNRLLATRQAHRADLLRQDFVTAALDAARTRESGAVIAAVGVGVRQQIAKEQWQRYALTGTSHLMAISGLHIGLAATAAGLLSSLVLGVLRVGTGQYVTAIGIAVAVACAYAMISGLGVPAQRAALMLLIGGITILRRRQIDVFRTLVLAAAVIFFAQPVATMTPGFHLSFAAVALLLWLSLRKGVQPPTTGPTVRLIRSARQLVVMQVFLLFGLMPLTALLFQRVAFLAVPANLVAVPLFSIVTVPCTLAGLALLKVWAPAADMLLVLAAFSIDMLEKLITQLLRLPVTDGDIAKIEGVIWLVLWLPALWALLPRGWPGRRVALLAVPLLVMQTPDPPAANCVDIHVLDVGQGLAIVMQTANTAVVYDTGASFRSGGSMAERVVVPFLKSRGIKHLDQLIVSHADDDHSGGVALIQQEVRIGQVLTGEPLRAPAPKSEPCRAGHNWQADGVRFRLLHPPMAPRLSGNNASCVLLVAVGRFNVLLTGDIEVAAERDLVRRGALSTVDVLVVPHHGSLTSSSAAFVRQLAPRVAIVSAGFANRWALPKQVVIDRWVAVGSSILNTAEAGAVSVSMCAESGIRKIRADRDERRRFWHASSQQVGQ